MENFTLTPLRLTHARHSRQGDITSPLLNIDRKYAEITPGENIELHFEVASFTPEISRSFVLVTTGRYKKTKQSQQLLSSNQNDEESIFPSRFVLKQNHPNPFNPITTMKYDLPEDSFVELRVYDLMGRKIRTLINGNENAGFKSVLWDSKEKNGRPVPSGMYFYRIDAFSKESDKKFHETRKMVLIR